MQWLKQDDGAAAIVVAIAAVGLMGMAAFTLDTSAIYEERRELQNGADASALAIAEDCFLVPASCTYGVAAATADVYSDANADDGATQVDQTTLDAIGQSVTVELRSETPEGGTVLAPFFGKVLGFDGASVTARASAEWGYVGGLNSFPLIISDCEWFDPARPPLQEGPPFTGDPWLFIFHQGNQGGTCDHSNSGFDLPGGFGWLDTQAGNCLAQVAFGEWAGVDPGSSPSPSCDAEELKGMLNTVVFLPYYEEKAATGNSGQYLVSGVGAFWLTGYNFGGQFKEPTGNPPCSGTTRCLAGYFIETTISWGDTGGPDRGLSTIKLTS